MGRTHSFHSIDRRLPLWLLAVALLFAASCYYKPNRPPLDDVVAARNNSPCRRQPETGDTVRWVEAEKETDQRELAEWCATVGPPVVIPAPAAVDSGGVDSLAVVSWNVNGGGGDVVELITKLRAGEFTDGLPVKNFVIFLQETHRAGPDVPVDVPDIYIPHRTEKEPPSGNRVSVVETAEIFGLSLFYVPSMRNGKPESGETEEDRGNAILCTFPMSDFVAIEQAR